MNGFQLQLAMRDLRWTRLSLAHHLGVSEGTVRNWLETDGHIPHEAFAWVMAATNFIRQNPPPFQGGRGKGRPQGGNLAGRPNAYQKRTGDAS